MSKISRKAKYYMVDCEYITKTGYVYGRWERFMNKREAIARAADYFNEAVGFRKTDNVPQIDTSKENRGWVLKPTVTRYHDVLPLETFTVDGLTSPEWVPMTRSN